MYTELQKLFALRDKYSCRASFRARSCSKCVGAISMIEVAIIDMLPVPKWVPSFLLLIDVPIDCPILLVLFRIDVLDS